jgi:DNA helicase HerA-like ATPase
MELFPRDCVVGVFRGFREGGMEFHADLTLPYRNDFQNIPMHGQFLLVQLETPDEAVLGRITSLSSEGRLSSTSGEEFNLRAVRENRPVPESLREDYLKYRVNIRVLGVIRVKNREGVTFVASHRRLPHVGSPVAFPSPEVLREIAGHNTKGAGIGHLALGEYIFAAGADRFEPESWMQVKDPCVLVRFPVESLVSRRTFVFARAGFGKSNLNKLLFSVLYSQKPTVEKRGGRRVPVGTLLFDPDGEYFWPDDKGRPGLCDVPELQNQIVVFTSRQAPGPFYQSFVAGDIKLDIRRLKPSDVISIALSPEKQDQQNVRKLKGLDAGRWARLVDLIHRHGNDADEQTIQDLLSLKGQQEMETLAARANMTTIVRMLHDPASQLMDMLLEALAAGKLCVVDVSQLRGGPSLVLSGLILRRIFDRNQEEFTKAEPKTIPTIAVVEEAQSVLNSEASGADPYTAWVKEGRKYDLGAVLITQQPGSIPQEILSQGDNWFVFHLLSAGDLQNVKKANAHFSEDLLATLLNEPIPGQGVFWSSVAGKPYPLPVRILFFEKMHARAADSYQKPAVKTFASEVREKYGKLLADARADTGHSQVGREPAPAGVAKGHPVGAPEIEVVNSADDGQAEEGEEEGVDALRTYQKMAIQALQNSSDFKRSINGPIGFPWGKVMGILENALPPSMPDRKEVAKNLVSEAVSEVLGGKKEVAWTTTRRDTATKSQMLFIVRIAHSQ